MVQVYVGIGSNIDRDRHIRAAVKELREVFGHLHLSTVYESKSVGFLGPNFYNLAAGFSTNIELLELVHSLRKIEYKYGRPAFSITSGDRTLDIDLLLYGVYRGAIKNIIIPRPEITFNAHVLCPFAEIAPFEIEPQSGKTYEVLWREFDMQNQKLWPIEFNWMESK